MVDFFGKKLSVGDDVVFVEPYYSNLCKGIITKITPKMITISYSLDKHGFRQDNKIVRRFSSQVMLVNN